MSNFQTLLIQINLLGGYLVFILRCHMLIVLRRKVRVSRHVVVRASRADLRAHTAPRELPQTFPRQPSFSRNPTRFSRTRCQQEHPFPSLLELPPAPFLLYKKKKIQNKNE